jgi:hypothetical protein
MRTLSLTLGLLLASTAAGQTLLVGGFDASRCRPLSLTGTLGYDTLRAALTNPANFGTGGIVNCSVTVTPETALADLNYLNTVDVFFIGDSFSGLSAAEAADLQVWHSLGGHIILLADSNGGTGENTVLAAIGAGTSYVGSGCGGPGTFSTASDEILGGPFGSLLGGTFSITPSTVLQLDNIVRLHVTCASNDFQWASYARGTVNGQKSGIVMIGGCPSWFDLFTATSSSFYDQNNLTYALNVFAAMCTGGGGGGTGIGTTFCNPSALNSSGAQGVLSAFGSVVAADDDLTLVASGLPNGQFAYYIGGMTYGFVPNAGGSQGNLCLVPFVARFTSGLGAIAGGQFVRSIDLVGVPLPPTLDHDIVAGETWGFQLWYRDQNPGPTSNFTTAVQVVFQ